MTGQSTTSSHRAKVNLTMTSITCNQCAEHATEGSKTGCCKESHGAIQDLSRGAKTKGGGGRSVGLRILKLTRSKPKHRRNKAWHGWGAELYWLKRIYYSHYRFKIRGVVADLMRRIK